MNNQINHMLDAALKALEDELAKRIKNPKGSWSIETLRSLVVDVMTHLATDSATESLVRQNAEFVTQKTGTNSPLRRTLNELLVTSTVESLESPLADRSLQVIRKYKDRQFFRMEDIIELRDAIDDVQLKESGQFPDETIELFEAVKTECSSITQKAAGKPIDPCWFALKLADFSTTVPADDCQDAYFLLMMQPTQQFYLPELETFSKWLRKVLSSSSTTKRKRRGRPPASNAERRKDQQVSERWERAKESGTRKQEFADDEGIPIDELEKRLRRTKSRKNLGK